MQIKLYKFDRVEFAGSLGDLGTLIPLSVGLILITGLNLTSVFLIVGIFYILIGIYYQLPIPVQPLKVVAAIAIAFPDKITVPIISAASFIFGATLLILAWTGIIEWMAKFFTKPVIRGIQLGLGLILLTKGIGFIQNPNLFIQKTSKIFIFPEIPLNLIIGIVGVILTLFLLSNSRFPAALVIVLTGAIIGVISGALKDVTFSMGPNPIKIVLPSFADFWSAFFLLVIPQIPLTIGNAIIGTADVVKSLFKDKERIKRATYRAFATSMGIVNIVVGVLSGMPVCHGAGGLAAHYRFGARTGGSNIMIGILFVIMALFFGKIGINLLLAIPNSILGTLLIFAGIELALLIKDITKRNDMFIVFMIAGIGLATKNMSIAFFVGILIEHFLKAKKIEV